MMDPSKWQKDFKMKTTTARIVTANAGKYIAQLCKHWSHKFETKWDSTRGQVDLPGGPVHFIADSETLTITIETKDEETSNRMRAVVQTHLDRFAFREVPLAYDWS
jgi:uncharacterized protein